MRRLLGARQQLEHYRNHRIQRDKKQHVDFIASEHIKIPCQMTC